MKLMLNFLTLQIFLFFFSNSVNAGNNVYTDAGQLNFGNYQIPPSPDWTYIEDKSAGEFFVFQNTGQKTEVALKKEPVPCANQQEFNKQIMQIIQNLQKDQWVVELRKPSAPYGFAGVKSCHFMKLKSKSTGQQKYVLHPLVKSKMYQIEIISESLLNEPPAAATDFIAQISTSDSQALAVKKSAAQTVAYADDPNVAISVTNEPETTAAEGALAGFKKVKAPTPSPKPVNPATGNAKPETQTTNSKTTPSTTSAGTTAASTKPVDIPLPSTNYNVEKGKIPDVKFQVSDPCTTGGSSDGLPWDSKSATGTNELPKGVDAAQTPIVPNLKSLSDVSYNSAVSTAFEAMRLVYGSMPDDEAKKFEAAWAPLFDFPSQAVIDYLNKLNPLVSQFLSCRESYIRSLADINRILLDASIAVEIKEQQAWEAAMAGAGISGSGLQPLEAAMKQLSQQLEALGNPPNPVAAKCEARNRYKKALNQQLPNYPFEGEWTDSDGNKSLLKTIYSYSDGKALVYLYPVSWVEQQKAKGFNMNVMGPQTATDGSETLSLPGIADLTSIFEEIEEGVWITKNTWSMFFDMYAYLIDGESMEMHHYIPPGGLANMQLTKSTGTKTNVCPDKMPVFPTYKKSWDEFVVEFSQGANNEYERYMKWRQGADADIQIVIEGPSARQKRKQEYEEKKAQVERRYRDPKDGAEDMQNLNQEYADVLGLQTPEVKKPETKTEQKPDDSAAKKLEAERIEQEKKDAIAFHTEMVQVISKNLEKEIADRDLAIAALSKSKTPQEAKANEERVKEFNLRIINIQSNVQAEQDLVTSFQTGQVVHTRTAFDEYAHNKFISDIRENAARLDATRRIASRIDRQIELLPPEVRAQARESARKVIDGKTIASGDIEKARKFANTITNQVQGYAEYDKAVAEEAEVDAQQNEFYAQTTIMAAGAVFMGLGSATLAETFGAQAAITVYGTQTLGAIYGGTTGLIAGGPKEGVIQAVSWWSPNGYAAMQFLEGYSNAGFQPDASIATKTWNGVQQAGAALFLGKVFEMGTGLIAKGSLVAFGNESRLFQPVIQSSSQRSKQVLDAMRTTQKLANAQDELVTFQNLEKELVSLRQNAVVNSQKIQQLEAQSQQLAAGMNASYYSKWLMKYKATPDLRWQFDKRVQTNYSEMTPGMTKRLEQQGYNMDGIEFRQFRNATSGGSSSMDLDLGPVLKGTMQEPGINKMIVKKDGSVVTMEQFMKDSQKAMNDEYKQLFGITAPSSDMNLVTSVHKEAFSTPKLLDHKINMSSFTVDEIASIGKVLSVKVEGISNNPMLTNTTKMQAQCRESSKEIENMLIRKLKEDLTKAPAGSPQQKQIQSDINYWEDMLKKFKQIGTVETDPMKIVQINREIMKDTGGKDVTGVINDLISAFKPK